jgi:hypothetical protein
MGNNRSAKVLLRTIFGHAAGEYPWVMQDIGLRLDERRGHRLRGGTPSLSIARVADPRRAL